MAAGELWSNTDDLVFTDEIGRPLDPGRVRSEFRSVLASAGLDTTFTPNHLRHTAASLMSDAGVPLEIVADQLGHRDTRMASLVFRHRVRPRISAGMALADALDPEPPTGTDPT